MWMEEESKPPAGMPALPTRPEIGGRTWGP